MRRIDDTPIDPEISAALEAIDATLAGEPVDPRHAELAELALLVAADRPHPEPAFAARLDERVERRFTRAPATASPRRPRRWLWAPAAGVVVAGAVVIAFVAGGSSGPQPPVRASSGVGSAAKIPRGAVESAPSTGSHASAAKPFSGQFFGSATATTASSASGTPLQPPSNGRKVVQAAQLALTTSSGHVDTVAQEVFDVVGQQRGIVSSSSVTAGGASGYAQFQLSVPSGSLPQTMAALSTLRYARVASRTDTSQDVNDQYLAAVRALADARALRTSLLKQLANATTQAQIDSLTARIHDAEASISSDEAALRQLNRRVDFSQIALTINAGPTPVSSSTGGGGGFTISRAAHDAGRVLTVAAGVALIVAAALLPLALLGALGWWISSAVRRRRREQALDAV